MKNITIVLATVLLSLAFNISTYACNLPPEAVIGSSTTTPQVGETVTFDGTNSYDPEDGDVTRYEWTFPPEAYYISGADTANPKCKFSPADTVVGYTVKLRVYDSTGLASQEATATILVSEASSSWYVKTAGDDDNDGQSWATAFKTIQVAIDGSIDDDTIEVAEGIYYESIDFRGKNITVRSSDPTDWEVVKNTIIDAPEGVAGVTFRGDEESGTKLQGFTITDGTLDDNVKAHWKLDESSGTTATDESAGQYDASLSGGTWIPGYDDGAVKLNGTNDFLVADGVGAANSYNGVSGSNPRTMAAWIKDTATSDTQTRVILSWGNNVTYETWVFSVNKSGNNGQAGAIRIGSGGGNTIGSTVVRDGHWHHVAAVLPDGCSSTSDIKLYVDGQLDPKQASFFRV